jgi:hypothetical protein
MSRRSSAARKKITGRKVIDKRCRTVRATTEGSRALPFRVYREMDVLKLLGNSVCLFHFDLFGRSV